MQGETVKENYCPLDRMHLTRAWSRVRETGRLYYEGVQEQQLDLTRTFQGSAALHVVVWPGAYGLQDKAN